MYPTFAGADERMVNVEPDASSIESRPPSRTLPAPAPAPTPAPIAAPEPPPAIAPISAPRAAPIPARVTVFEVWLLSRIVPSLLTVTESPLIDETDWIKPA